jgi:hypothetical protein
MPNGALGGVFGELQMRQTAVILPTVAEAAAELESARACLDKRSFS